MERLMPSCFVQSYQHPNLLPLRRRDSEATVPQTCRICYSPHRLSLATALLKSTILMAMGAQASAIDIGVVEDEPSTSQAASVMKQKQPHSAASAISGAISGIVIGACLQVFHWQVHGSHYQYLVPHTLLLAFSPDRLGVRPDNVELICCLTQLLLLLLLPRTCLPHVSLVHTDGLLVTLPLTRSWAP